MLKLVKDRRSDESSLAGVLSLLLPPESRTGLQGFTFFTMASTASPAAIRVSHDLLVRNVIT